MSNYKVDITGINTSTLKCLTHEENIKLFKLYHNGDLKAKDDLFQVGVIGLIKAIDNFDLSYNLKLSTYAVPIA